ncbi:hypothetical protein L484_002868 [Morus notabilis]|uniref:Uncharacterized protein n=1 Tax=Morus notabilis TaxID=981085 RepID=W9RUM7_9ROSA|nr:hypothetical protein L484_002868 [Morus notabilis]
MHALLENIMDYVADIKRSFDEKLIEPYYDEELVRLLFLDGCAMLGFIQSYVNKKLNMFRLSNEVASLIQRDLFALEVLMGLRERENVNLKHEFCRFIALMSTSPGDFTEFVVMRLVDENPVHILDLLREVLLFDDPIFFHPCGYMLTNLVRTCGCGAAALICCMMVRFNKSLRLPKEKSNIMQYSFRNVQELKKAGIDFKPSDSLTTIYFRSPFNISAQLMLPKILVDDSTEHKLLTLVAYEMSLSGSHPNHEPWVTCYVNLLDLLVDNEQDVKDLKAADILQNCLGSDIAAAQLINNMGTKFFPPATDTYEHVKNKVERHCRNKCRRRIARRVKYTPTLEMQLLSASRKREIELTDSFHNPYHFELESA